MPKKRKPFTGTQLVKAAGVGEKYVARQQNAVKAANARQAQRNHTAEVAKLAPNESPLAELLRAARTGDPDAVWRADALYGSSWRVKRKAVA